MEHGKYISEEVSWITPVLGITEYQGIEDIERRFQYGLGNDYIINTAGELNNKADVKIPVEPSTGARQTLKRVDMIADIIHEQLYSFKRYPSEYRVIVHCAMGMERSVLATAWYLQKYENYTLDSAYQKIHEVRPVACDRTSWIGKELETPLKEPNWGDIYESWEPVRYEGSNV